MSPRRSLSLIAAALCAAALGTTAPTARAGALHSCQPVVNPYAGSRYEGVDLSHVLARNVSCQTARRVARGAHFKAIGLTPPPSGIRQFTWHGWRVTGNIRGSVDRYLATQPGGKRVRWRF